MDRPVQTVRLIGVVLMSSVAVLFVHYYGQWVRNELEFEHEAIELTAACQFLSDYGRVGLALPVLMAAVGGFAIVKKRRLLHEIALASTCVLSVAWVLFTIVAWQVERIPIFHGMRWHY